MFLIDNSTTDYLLKVVSSRLLTNHHQKGNHKENSFSQQLKKNYFFFLCGDLYKNQYYNHFAFAVIENVLVNYYKLPRINLKQQSAILGILLLKFEKFEFINANLNNTFNKLDGACLNVASSNECSIDDVLNIIIYFSERHSSHGIYVKIDFLLKKLAKTLSQNSNEKIANTLLLKSLLFINSNPQRPSAYQHFEKMFTTHLENYVNKMETSLVGYKILIEFYSFKQSKKSLFKEIHHSYEKSDKLLDKLGYAQLLKKVTSANKDEIKINQNIHRTIISMLNERYINSISINECLEVGLFLLSFKNGYSAEKFGLIDLLN